MSKFIYIDSYVIKDFNNSPFFQKLVNLCSTNPAKKKAVIVNSPNEKKIFDYFLATGLKFSSENPKDCGDATFIGRDIRSLHNKTGNNKVLFESLKIDTVFIIDPLANFQPSQLAHIFKVAKNIHYLTTELAFKKLLINEFDDRDSFFFNVPLFIDRSNVASVSHILNEYTPFWNLLGANNIFKQTFYKSDNYLYHNPGRPLTIFNGETRDLVEVAPEDIILTDTGDMSSKTMNSINNLKSEVALNEEKSQMKVALEEIMKYNETLTNNTLAALKDFFIPIQERIEALHAENNSLKELIEDRFNQTDGSSEIAFYEDVEDNDPLQAFRI